MLVYCPIATSRKKTGSDPTSTKRKYGMRNAPVTVSSESAASYNRYLLERIADGEACDFIILIAVLVSFKITLSEVLLLNRFVICFCSHLAHTL